MKITKKDICFFTVILILSATIIYLMIIAAHKVSINAVSQQYEDLPIIVIDAGHGGEDGGATVAGGTISEKDINLAIAKDLNQFFIASGFRTIMIREDDTDISDNGTTIKGKRQISDLSNRVSAVNSQDKAILISIHQNKFSQSQYCGTQIFYSDNEDSKILAENIRSSVVSMLQPNNTRKSKQAGTSIYLLDNVNCPAVLVECGFMSNPTEYKNLMDEDYQKNMAFSIFSGFLDYWRAS